MRRLFALLTLCCLSISMAWADSESLYVYRNDGDFNYFVTDRLDSVVYSNIDMAGKACSEPVVQEFWVQGKATRIPLAAIDSIRFVSPEENLRLVDPVRYKRPADDAAYNPNILMDAYQTADLVSIDTTSWMATVHFNGDVPYLYKGSILVLPYEDTYYAMRILEAYQSGSEARVHVFPASVQELFFNLDLRLGDFDNASPMKARKKAGSNKDVMVEFCKTELGKDFEIGMDIGVDKFDWSTKANCKLKVSGPHWTDDGIVWAEIDTFYLELKGGFDLDMHLSFSPKVVGKGKVSWNWTTKPFHIPVTIPIPGSPIPLKMNFDVDLACEVETTLKAGNLTWYQPYNLNASVTLGMDYVKERGAKSLNDFSYNFNKAEATTNHTPDLELTITAAPIYPKVKVYFFGFDWAGYSMEAKPTLTYNARSQLFDGQEVFQHRVDAGLEGKMGLYQTITNRLPETLSFLDMKFGPWKVWSEPSILQNQDSLRNVYLYQKHKIKNTVKVMGEEVKHVSSNQPAPKPTPTELNNPLKVEVRTKAKLIDPNSKSAPEVMNNPNYKGDAMDDNGFFEWANEYQITDPVPSTIKPIYEMLTPSGIDTKQLIIIRDPETDEVIDSTEIVPITSIKNYDIEFEYVVVVPNQEYDTIHCNVQVRDFGNHVEEKGWRHEVRYCPRCRWHHTRGTITGHGDVVQGSPTGASGYYSESGHVEDCEGGYSYNDGGPVYVGLGSSYYANHSLPNSVFIPEQSRGRVRGSIAETLGGIRWLQDVGVTKDDVAKFEDTVYRGIEATKFSGSDGDGDMTYWQNILLCIEKSEGNNIDRFDVLKLIIYPDTIPGQPHGDEPIKVIAEGGQSTGFGDGNAPENRVTAGDKPNLPANLGQDDSGQGGGGGAGTDNSLGSAEWTDKWEPGIYEMGMDDERIMIAISTDKWTYYIPNVADHDGENQEEFDDVDYDYSDYTTHMPCKFKWCDRGSTTYHYIENPQTGKGEVKEFKFKDRAAMCNIMGENGLYGFGDVKMILSYLKPEYMQRVADAGTHDETYKTILKRYTK